MAWCSDQPIGDIGEFGIGKTILQGPAYVTPPWFYVIQWETAEGVRIFGRERSQPKKQLINLLISNPAQSSGFNALPQTLSSVTRH
jgi:hypothetical protein